MDEEIWKDVPGYEGYYEVSNYGRIRSWYTGGGFRRRKPYFKKIQTDKHGYRRILLYKTGNRGQNFIISRLVLHAFVRAPKDGEEASHRDGDNTNNRLDNLVWETRFENEQRKRQHGTRPIGEGNHASKLTLVQVKEIRRLRNEGRKLSYLSSRYGVSESNICAICKGRIWTHV